MTEVQAFLSFLQAGGDAAMIGLFFLMWKFDRRLIRIETIMDKNFKTEAQICRIIDSRIRMRSEELGEEE